MRATRLYRMALVGVLLSAAAVPASALTVDDLNSASYTRSGAWLAAGTTGDLPLVDGIGKGFNRGIAWSCATGSSGRLFAAYANGSLGEIDISSTGDVGHAYASVITGVPGCKIQAIY